MNVPDQWRLLFKRLGLVFLLYQLLRILFLANNWSTYQSFSMPDLLLAWWGGLRFDLWAVLWSMLPVILVSFLPVEWQRKPALETSLWWLVILLQFWCLGLNIIDVELFKFTSKRLTMAWLKLQQDVQTQSGSLVSYYWWLAGVGILLWLVVVKFWPRWPKQSAPGPVSRWRLVWPVLIFILLFSGLRGGWQMKPISLSQAYAVGAQELGTLRLNSTFSFFRSPSGSETVALRFFRGRELERDKFLAAIGPHKSLSPDATLAGYNVVLIIVESLASEYVGVLNNGKGYTPFFDELARKGLLFQNNFANGRRSIEAVPSIICGLPSLMGEAWLLSPFQSVNLDCLPKLLAAQNYQSHFFHGAYNGSMHFDSFAARAGFSSYIGYNEYANAKDSDGFWGIYDEPFLLHMIERLKTVATPFFATVFTLTSHHPYPIPEKYKNQFPQGELEIHPSIGYTDWSLRQFFSEAAKQSWYAKTLFVITGDHTHKSQERRYQSTTGGYRVPLLLYVPGQILKANPDKITQHIDILPTLLELVGAPANKSLRFGQSVLADRGGAAFNGDERGYWYLSEEQLVEYNLSLQQLQYSRFNSKDWGTTRIETEQLDDAARNAGETLKSVIDYFNQGIVENRLYREY